jgi:toxin ParE1/3/4
MKREGLGVQFMDKVEDAIERIADHPLAFRPIVENVRRANLERFPYGLWFTLNEDGSIVLACLHHKRDNPKLARQVRLGRN